MRHYSPISGVSAWGGRWVATAGYDNRVVLWDAASGKPLSLAHHDHLANQCDFSPRGDALVTASSDESARVWSLPDLRLSAVLNGHGDDVEMAVFDPLGERVATACRDGRVRVFERGGALLATLEGHTRDVISVTWSADARYLLSSSDDGTVRRWDARRGLLLETVDLGGVETDTLVVMDEKVIIAGTDDGELVVIADGARRSVRAHDAGIKRIVKSSDRLSLVTLSYDRQVAVWTLVDGLPRERVRSAFPPEIWARSACFIDSERIAFATFGSTYAEWDLETGLWDVSRVQPTHGVNAVATDAQGRELTIGDAGLFRRGGDVVTRVPSLCNFLLPTPHGVLSGGQTGAIFDVANGVSLWQHRSPINCAISVGTDARDVAVGTYTGEVLFARHTASGLAGAEVVRVHANAIKGLAYGDGIVFSACADGSVAFHDLATKEELRRVPGAHDRIANGCGHLGGGTFFSVSRDRTLRLWTLAGPARVVETPHSHSVKCCASDPSGRWIATASYNGTLAVYDVAEGTWAVERLTHAGISSLTFDPISRSFLCGSYDGRVYAHAPS